MDTEKKFGLKKSKAILLFIQMILTVILLVASVYLLIFTLKNGLSGVMIASYVFIVISILAVIFYSTLGFKKGELIYKLSVAPFLVAVFINILLPTRDAFQIALLTLLFAVGFAFLVKQEDYKFTCAMAIGTVIISLVFSVYSSVTANTQFLGDISENLPTYVAMYTSIFIPTVMSGTLALTYNVRSAR